MDKKFFVLFATLAVAFSLTSRSFAATFEDDFNDGIIDLNKWEVADWNNTTPVTESMGSLNIDYPPGSSYGGLLSNYLFSGDFDIRTRWKNWQFSGVSGPYINNVAQVGLMVMEYEEDNSGTAPFAYVFRGWHPSNGDYYVGNAFVNGDWIHNPEPLTTPDDTEGYLAIKRDGGTISTFYSDVNYADLTSWNRIAEMENITDKPVDLWVWGYTGDHTTNFHAEWDFVTANAGSVELLDEQVVTPEPASMLLFGLGGAAMAFSRRRKA